MFLQAELARHPERGVAHRRRNAAGERQGAAGPSPSFDENEGQVVKLTRHAFERLRRTVGKLPCERGGIFVSRRGPFFVEDFLFDDASDKAQSVYYPNADYLNSLLERDYEPHGYRFVGVGHSHPAGVWRPSGDTNWGDVKAARNNLLAESNADLPGLFIPIIESKAVTGRFWLHAFIMLREDMQIRRARVEVVDEAS